MSLIVSGGVGAGQISVVDKKQQQLIAAAPKRTSALEAPIMLLTGHEGEVFSLRFNPEGTTIASASFDKTILLWNVYGDCRTYGVLQGHTNAVIEVSWSQDGQTIFSASADKTLGYWDAVTGQKKRRFRDHKGIVNSCCASRKDNNLVVSGSDDHHAKVWDIRYKTPIYDFDCKYPVLTVAFADGGDQIFTAGIDNDIKAWDLRKQQVVFTMPGHTNSVTGIRLSPDGSHLLSNSMDNTVRMWDVRPFVQGGQRCTKIFYGVQHGVDKNLLRCCWSPDGSKVCAGSSDSPTHVYVWDAITCEILYKLPGHKAAVNDVDFHPTEPILGSCSSDKTIFLGELGAD